MIRLAAIDTSTWWGGLALLEAPSTDHSPELVAEAGILVRDSHSAHVLPVLQALLEQVSWPRDSLDAFAAARGPGSFTGIRIGLGTVRGLALAADRPCFGIGTLEALAEAHGPDERDRVPMLDAGRGEVYAARYTAASVPPEPTVAPWVGAPENAVPDRSSAPVVFGPGATLHTERLIGAGAVVRPAPTGIAAAVGRLALVRIAAGAEPGEGLSPLYIRPPDAILKMPDGPDGTER